MRPLASRLPLLGAEHLVLLAVFAVGCVALAYTGRAVRGRAAEPVASRLFAALLVGVTVPLQVLQLLPDDFTVGGSLPLELCDLAWVVAAYALWTGSLRVSQLLYYWVPLVAQAIITPDVHEAFPEPRWWMFWGMHFLSLWAVAFLTFGLRRRPSWPGYRFALLVTAAWAGLAMAINALIGTDYGYLNRKPEVSSLLDLLGPWPAYVVLEVLVVAAVWALMTWPWQRRTHPAGPVPV